MIVGHLFSNRCSRRLAFAWKEAMTGSIMQTLGMTLVLMLMSPMGVAGGLWLYELGTPDVGTAAAGRAALAQDAATAEGNPAGMTRLEGSQLMTTLQPVIIDAQFNAKPGTTFSGGGGGNAGGFVPSLGLFYVHDVSPDLKLGLAIGSAFGLGLDYGNRWAGRYYITEGKLLTVAVNPSIGYRVNEWLSIGAGPVIVLGDYLARSAINNLLPGVPDGSLKFKDLDVGVGGRFGILIEPRNGTRFGITYSTEIDLDFEDQPELTGLDLLLRSTLKAKGLIGSDVTLGITVPQAVMVSAYHELTDQWAIMGNLGWQDQSAFGNVGVAIDSVNGKDFSFTSNADFTDTWHFAIGTQYRFRPSWRLSLGFAYDTSPVSTANRTPSLPLDRQLRYAAGIQYDWSEAITLGVAYELLDAGSGTIVRHGGRFRGNLVGDFDPNFIHFVGFNLNWKL